VLIKSAFTTPPDPREVLRMLFAGGSLFSISAQDQAFVSSRADSDIAKHPGVVEPPATNNVRRGRS